MEINEPQEPSEALHLYATYNVRPKSLRRSLPSSKLPQYGKDSRTAHRLSVYLY